MEYGLVIEIVFKLTSLTLKIGEQTLLEMTLHLTSLDYNMTFVILALIISHGTALDMVDHLLIGKVVGVTALLWTFKEGIEQDCLCVFVHGVVVRVSASQRTSLFL